MQKLTKNNNNNTNEICLCDVLTHSWLMCEELMLYLGLGDVGVHRVSGFEDFLNFLLGAEEKSQRGRGGNNRLL